MNPYQIGWPKTDFTGNRSHYLFTHIAIQFFIALKYVHHVSQIITHILIYVKIISIQSLLEMSKNVTWRAGITFLFQSCLNKQVNISECKVSFVCPLNFVPSHTFFCGSISVIQFQIFATNILFGRNVKTAIFASEIIHWQKNNFFFFWTLYVWYRVGSLLNQTKCI